MQNYRTLARMFHADKTNEAYGNLEREAKARLSADSTLRSGIVTPLGELFVAMPAEVSLRIEQILVQESEINGLWAATPGIIHWNFIVHYLSEEMLATNEIEGVRSTRKEVERAIDIAKNGAEKPIRHTRFGEFARLYLNLTDREADFPKTLNDIRSIYDQVIAGEIKPTDVPDGELFRKGDVEIQGRHGEAIHSGVSGEARISVLLTEMMKLVDSTKMPRLQAAILSHFIFEYVHPFYDGNGRTGRYLLALYLSRVLSLPTVLSLSRVIAGNLDAYYRAFSEAEHKLNHGELTFFVSTILDFIADAQTDLIDELSIKLDQLGKVVKASAKLAEEYGLSVGEHDLLVGVIQEELFDTHVDLSLQTAAERMRRSKQSVRKYMAVLIEKELLVMTSRRPVRVGLSERVRAQLDLS